MHTTVFIAMCAIPDILAKESFLFETANIWKSESRTLLPLL